MAFYPLNIQKVEHCIYNLSILPGYVLLERNYIIDLGKMGLKYMQGTSDPRTLPPA